MTRVLVPLPNYGADPTEVAIPWKLLTENGYGVTFATPKGQVATPDWAMLHGKNLGIWRSLLKTRSDAVEACLAMQNSAAFLSPQSYQDVNEADFDALLLPGGHDKGVKEYLESPVLQRLVADFFLRDKPVAAICHGVVLAARSVASDTGKSVIAGYNTSCLLKSQELLAYQMTRLWLNDYYLTYPELTVEDEVTAALDHSAQFHSGPTPALRDDMQHLDRGFTVRDRNYLSA
ncbi:MAG: protease I, partial [Halioglobus sp.]